MDPLVMAAGTALVAAIATDAWQQARAGAVAVWQRVYPERAVAIEAELEHARAALLAARRDGDTRTEGALADVWRERLAQLVAADPDVLAEIQRVLEQVWTPLIPTGQPAVRHITMHATATGSGRVYQAGGDQQITGP
ncbi:hypothetical protein [Streptomyces sp. MNP-20]|uniref:hypothetical protein n=1 Tax=Streptomyces sp. MNP-20 TaxID=2721165 RepID=UPI001553DE63|nr:hypothetical protein [Streptomyces sp. MNP-20]